MMLPSKWITPLAVLGAALFGPALLQTADAQSVMPGQRTIPDPRLRTVLFAPEDLALVKGDPGERRRFLDDLLVARQP